MSTWGGIGEGLAAGMNSRIALAEQRRRERQAQENADRQFAFQQSQADTAQANAERQMNAQDAARAQAQANADRDFALRSRAADTDAALKGMDMELRGLLGQLDADMKREELEGRREDRQLRSRSLDLQELRDDREDALRNRQFTEQQVQADREYQLKKETQGWANKTSEERLRSFRTANDKLDREERQARMQEEERKASGRQQLAMALYRVTGAGGEEQTITLNENGQQVQKKVRVLPQSAKEQIFGKDGYFSEVQNVIAFENENGDTVAALVKPDGTMQMFSPDQQYAVYESGFGRQFADEQMRGAADRRDLGMFTAKEQARANAQVTAREASDPYGRKRQIDAAVAVLKADDASEADRSAALQYLGSVFGGTANRAAVDPNSPKGRQAIAQGYTFDGTMWHPPKRKKVIPVGSHPATK